MSNLPGLTVFISARETRGALEPGPLPSFGTPLPFLLVTLFWFLLRFPLLRLIWRLD